MAKARPSVLKRIREMKKAERAEEKRMRRAQAAAAPAETSAHEGDVDASTDEPEAS